MLLSLHQFWLVGMLLTASRGKTRILGFVAMAIVVCMECTYTDYCSRHHTFAETPALKLLYLLPFVWLLFESRKRRPEKGS